LAIISARIRNWIRTILKKTIKYRCCIKAVVQAFTDNNEYQLRDLKAVVEPMDELQRNACIEKFFINLPIMSAAMGDRVQRKSV
jgi:hypothetical protein